MILSITSWNMQGGFRDKESRMKLPESNRIRNTNILLIQEAGNPNGAGINVNEYATLFGKTFKCVACETDQNAQVNLRCTTCILVDQYVSNLNYQIYVVGYVGYRPIVGLRINGSYICTVHDIADGTSYNIKSLLSRVFADKGPWMLMGDLNCDPGFMSGLPNNTPNTPVFVNAGTHDRPHGFFEIYPAGPTQGAGGVRTAILDYVLADETMLPHLSSMGSYNIENEMATDRYLNYLSDHNMINCLVDI